MTHQITGHAEVLAALADPALIPLPAEPGPRGTMAWLRSHVARFSSGETHARRRAIVEAELARLDPELLHKAAVGAEPRPTGVVRTLAAALGWADPDAVADSVLTVSAAYFGAEVAGADAAVQRLVAMSQEADDEMVANRIGILVQACEATGALVARALATNVSIAEVLTDDPPVRATRRLAIRDTEIAGYQIAEGEEILLDLTEMTFSGPPRACPGREHAIALATGVVEGVLR